MATKEQERKALEQIRGILEGLGKDSYVGKAFEGCIEDAEENIRYDTWTSMKDRYDQAMKDLMDTRAREVESGKEAKRLADQLERELEWKPYVDTYNVGQEDYEDLAKNGATREMTDEEAKDILYRQYGFAKEKVQIVRQLPKYEINRHRQLRKVGVIDRRPVYNATDWNYICFSCGAMSYEMSGDNLSFFR